MDLRWGSSKTRKKLFYTRRSGKTNGTKSQSSIITRTRHIFVRDRKPNQLEPPKNSSDTSRRKFEPENGPGRSKATEEGDGQGTQKGTSGSLSVEAFSAYLKFLKIRGEHNFELKEGKNWGKKKEGPVRDQRTGLLATCDVAAGGGKSRLSISVITVRLLKPGRKGSGTKRVMVS